MENQKLKPSFVNKYGIRSSTRLDQIKDVAQDYIYGGRGYSESKFHSKKYQKLVIQFEKEARKIGGVNYNLAFCIG